MFSMLKAMNGMPHFYHSSHRSTYVLRGIIYGYNWMPKRGGKGKGNILVRYLVARDAIEERYTCQEILRPKWANQFGEMLTLTLYFANLMVVAATRTWTGLDDFRRRLIFVLLEILHEELAQFPYLALEVGRASPRPRWVEQLIGNVRAGLWY